MVGFGRVQGDEERYGINRGIGKKGWINFFVCFPSSWLRNSSSPVLYRSPNTSSSMETGVLLDSWSTLPAPPPPLSSHSTFAFDIFLPGHHP